MAAKDTTGDEYISTSTAWTYTFASVFVISVCGLVPIICMPRLQRSRYQNDLLQFLIGLAIGTLTADALLHLLPISSLRQSANSVVASNLTNHDQSRDSTKLPMSLTSTPPISSKDKQEYTHTYVGHHQDTHNHQEHLATGGEISAASHSFHSSSHHHNEEGFWFGFMALVGIIGFLVLERIMVLVTDICSHKEHSVASTKPDSELKGEVSVLEPHLHSHQNHHQHQHHHLTNKTRSFMFMIITGDGLHNFFDGIAIGVSYGSSLTVGLSTSIAILCHELPHEIGDFAVLIKSGMSIKQAVLYNTLSSILCLLGATTGVFIGKIDVGWVSALIAGMFLYISLVDMVPQLDCYPAEPALIRVKKLIVQLSGIGAGVAIMSLIATYELRLHSLISNNI